MKNSKKKNTWLWILGWIFIFPVPLAFLLDKNKKLKPIIKIPIIIFSCLIYMVVIFGNSDNSDMENPPNEFTTQKDSIVDTNIDDTEKKDSTQIEKSLEDVINYDKLQSLFLTFSFETTEDNLIKWIEDNSLEYTAEEYNSRPRKITYTIAYEPDVALQRYAKSGDHIDISFNTEDGAFMYAEYFNNNTFKTALLYNYGTYWKLMEEEENNKYSGYYYHKPGDSEGGITIKYNNGNSTETGYHNVENGKAALSSVLE